MVQSIVVSKRKAHQAAAATGYAPDEIVLEVVVPSDGYTVKSPTSGAGHEIDWGDGSGWTVPGVTNQSYTYATAGTYIWRARPRASDGTQPTGFNSSNAGTGWRTIVTKIIQFPHIIVGTNYTNAFNLCTNLVVGDADGSNDMSHLPATNMGGFWGRVQVTGSPQLPTTVESVASIFMDVTTEFTVPDWTQFTNITAFTWAHRRATACIGVATFPPNATNIQNAYEDCRYIEVPAVVTLPASATNISAVLDKAGRLNPTQVAWELIIQTGSGAGLNNIARQTHIRKITINGNHTGATQNMFNNSAQLEEVIINGTINSTSMSSAFFNAGHGGTGTKGSGIVFTGFNNITCNGVCTNAFRDAQVIGNLDFSNWTITSSANFLLNTNKGGEGTVVLPVLTSATVVTSFMANSQFAIANPTLDLGGQTLSLAGFFSAAINVTGTLTLVNHENITTVQNFAPSSGISVPPDLTPCVNLTSLNNAFRFTSNLTSTDIGNLDPATHTVLTSFTDCFRQNTGSSLAGTTAAPDYWNRFTDPGVDHNQCYFNTEVANIGTIPSDWGGNA